MERDTTAAGGRVSYKTNLLTHYMIYECASAFLFSVHSCYSLSHPPLHFCLVWISFTDLTVSKRDLIRALRVLRNLSPSATHSEHGARGYSILLRCQPGNVKLMLEVLSMSDNRKTKCNSPHGFNFYFKHIATFRRQRVQEEEQLSLPGGSETRTYHVVPADEPLLKRG